MGQEDQELLIRGGSKHTSAEHLNNVSIITCRIGYRNKEWSYCNIGNENETLY